MAPQMAVMLAASTSEQAWPFFLVMVALELILSALCHMLKVVATSSTARVRVGSSQRHEPLGSSDLLLFISALRVVYRNTFASPNLANPSTSVYLPLLALRAHSPSPSCAPPIQHMAWPRASIDLTGSGCQATMVGTSECLGDILLCSMTCCCALGALVPQRYS